MIQYNANLSSFQLFFISHHHHHHHHYKKNSSSTTSAAAAAVGGKRYQVLDHDDDEMMMVSFFFLSGTPRERTKNSHLSLLQQRVFVVRSQSQAMPSSLSSDQSLQLIAFCHSCISTFAEPILSSITFVFRSFCSQSSPPNSLAA